jgi:NAD(P)-dependent dehydrogenase (short-subunit alcohol dehydrogenase family)
VIGDVAGVRGWPSYLPHSAAKGAQRALVSGLARSLAPRHRINIVHPGTVLPPDDVDGAALERIVERIPLSRLGTPADIAGAVRYLLTADYVTGAELIVDGGRLAQ